VVASDEDLLTAARRGDADAFAVFYRRHAGAITAFHRRRVPSPELAFDLTAETFAALVGALDRFDPSRGSARGWLFAIAANEWRQALRRMQVEDRARRALALEPIVLDDAALARVEARASGSELDALMAALPAAEREAVEARVLAEDGYAEIAERLRCSEAVVRQRVSRGLRRLRKAMAEDGAR
jgi:RNA polymerase sigma factor (sigma-70 family)